MTNGDDVRVMRRDGSLEEVVTHDMRRILDGPVAGCRDRAYVDPIDHERPLQRCGHACAELLIIDRRIAKLVVQVSNRDEFEIPGIIQSTEEMDESHRIGSARQRSNDPGRWRGESMPLQRSPDTTDQRHAMEPWQR